MVDEVVERLIKLETTVDGHTEREEKMWEKNAEDHREIVGAIDRKLNRIETCLSELKRAQERHKGFVGGMMFVISGIVTAVALFLNWWSK